jgi:VIT1/CCC1 family predicted Fe2+/Mn2+ transporter
VVYSKYKDNLDILVDTRTSTKRDQVMKIIEKSLLKPSIFGMFDGLTSLLGVLIPLLGYVHLLVFTTCLGLTVSSAISMGLGEYLSSDKEIPKNQRIKNSTYMGIFTGLGCFLPVIPFLFTGGMLALGLSIGIYFLCTLIVAYMKSEDIGWKSALIQTFLTSGIAIVLVILTTLAIPVPAG